MLSIPVMIQRAAAQIAAVSTPQGVMADVGCCLESGSGEYFYGVCVGVNSGAVCAERVAIAAMVTASRSYEIRRIVAVWKDPAGAIFVIPPCGHCRQFMHDLHPNNIRDTRVILDHDRLVSLGSLLPFHDWWQKQPVNGSR